MGLMLSYKKFPDKYFDINTGKEFPHGDIDKHPWWYKYEYDINNRVIYQENYDGYWTKWEYNQRGNEIYKEESDGYWEKREYDDNGDMTYYENSNRHIIKHKIIWA